MSHIAQEGLLDKAERLKREREAQEARVLNGLKLQRAILATIAVAAVAAAVVFGMRDAAHANNTATLESETSAKIAELNKVKADADVAVTAERAKYNELSAAVTAEREASAASTAAYEAKLSALAAEKVGLLAKIDALKANSAPVVTVFGSSATATSSSSEASATVVAPQRTAIKLPADKLALSELAPWAKTLSTYGRAEGPGSNSVFTYKRFRAWAVKNEQTLRDRATAKGWDDEKVQAMLKRINDNSESIDLAYADLATTKRDTVRNASWTAYKATQVRALAKFIDVGYADIQIAGYIMSDAEKVGPLKLCNE